MNTWIIVGIIAGLLIVGGVAVVNAVTADKPAEQIDCSDCGNSCSLNNNCGLSTCAAVSGGGGCGCGK